VSGRDTAKTPATAVVWSTTALSHFESVTLTNRTSIPKRQLPMLIYALLLFCIFVLDLTILLTRHQRTLRFQLNAGLILVMSFFFYTAALPISRLVLRTQSSDVGTDEGFMFNSLLAALGLTLGLLASRLAKSHPNVKWVDGSQSRTKLRRATMVLTVTFAIFSACYYFLYHAGFSLDVLAGAYGADNSITNENVTIVDTLLLLFAISAVLHYLYAVKVRALKKGATVAIMNALCLVLFAMFFIQSHRNLMLFMGLSALGLWYYGRPIRLATFATVAALSIVAFYTIGIVRNWGWAQLDQVTIGESALDPLHGELGVPFGVYEKLPYRANSESLELGRTYTIDAAVNLVPQQLWRGRPPSPAEEFSREYFNTDSLPEGLGFSPLVESIINFSSYGVFFVFALAAFIFIRLDQWARRAHRRVGVLISCILLPTIVNWNRIDFAACSKMFLIFCAFFWGLDKLLYSPVRAGDLLHSMNRIESPSPEYVRIVASGGSSTEPGFSPQSLH
jgi:hypothetical protein